MKTKNIVIVLISLLTLFSCKSPKNQVEHTDKQKPNIILISADDLGWSDVGCYGSEVQTPNLDKLGEGGMRFTNFHNTSKCFSSRACLLTGVYAQQNNYHLHHRNPITNAVTLGEVLRTAGYRTLWSGKHHGLENPVTRGFDRYYGLKDGACNYFNPGDQRPGEGAPARKGRPGNKTVRAWCIDSTMFNPYTPEAKDFYTTDYFAKYAIDWLEEYRSEEKPFFLYLAFTAPHDPLMAWPEDIEKYKGKYDEGYENTRKARYANQLKLKIIDGSYHLSEPTYQNWTDLPDSVREQETRKMEVYAAMIDRMDQNIGKVLKKLEEIGKDENTLILFVSDNGASAEMVNLTDDYGEIGTITKWTSLGKDWANVGNTPFRYYKNYSYEGGINTPLIAYWPGKIKPLAFSDFPGHFIDLMATFVDLTDAQYPKEFNNQEITPMQGESLLPAFFGEKKERERPIFWEWQNGQAAYDRDFKIVKDGLNTPWELYNLKSDPTETKNLAASNSEKVEQLEKLFFNWKAGLPEF